MAGAPQIEARSNVQGKNYSTVVYYLYWTLFRSVFDRFNLEARMLLGDCDMSPCKFIADLFALPMLAAQAHVY
jgi:hypothetical protein